MREIPYAEVPYYEFDLDQRRTPVLTMRQKVRQALMKVAQRIVRGLRGE